MRTEDVYMEWLKEECAKDGIDFWAISVFLEKDMANFYKSHIEEIQVNGLLEKRKLGHDEQTEYLLKNILQNTYVAGPAFIKKALRDRRIKRKNDCLDFLDRIKEPYKYIYSPLYFWKTDVYSAESFASRQVDWTGITGVSHFMAREYASYKIMGDREKREVIFFDVATAFEQNKFVERKNPLT